MPTWGGSSTSWTRGIIAAEYHLAQFPDSPRRPRACWLLGRLLFLNADRYISDQNEEVKRDFGVQLSAPERGQLLDTYYGRIFSLIAEGQSLESDLLERARLFELRGEILVRTGRPAEAEAEFERSMAQYDPTLDQLTIKLAEARLNSMQYEELLRQCRKAIDQFPRTNNWPHYVWLVHKACRHLGRIDEGMALWEEFTPRLRAGAAGEPIEIGDGGPPHIVPTEYRIDYQRYLDRAGFYRGFYLLALGRAEEASKVLREYIDGLRIRVGEGEALAMDTKVYLENQAEPLERRISLFLGIPAPTLGNSLTWVQPPPEETRTGVCRLRLICPSNSAKSRHADLIEVLSRLGNEYWPRGLQVEWVGLAMTERMIEVEVAAMQEIARKHRLGWTIGVDTGPEHTTHFDHQVITGGVVLFLTDPEGVFTWELIDPMNWDEGLIRRVLERVLPR